MEEINPLKNPDEYQEKVLFLMKSYELLLQELYAIYAEKLPEQGAFWKKISQEEESHAYWIDTLANQIGNNKVYFNEERFNIAPLNECIDEAGIRVAEAKNESISMMDAAAVSINIENGMIEKNFFNVFESDSPEIKKTFSMLRTATMQHENSVREMWEEERMKNNKDERTFLEKIKSFFN